MENSYSSQIILGQVSGIVHVIITAVYLLVGNGIFLTRHSLHRKEIIIILIIAMVTGFSHYVRDSNVVQVNMKSLPSMVINSVKLSVAFALYRFSSLNIDALSYILFQLFRVQGLNVSETSVYFKRNILIQLRECFIGYAVVITISHLIFGIADAPSEALEITSEALFFLLNLKIGIVFKCRTIKHKYYVTYTSGLVEDIQYGIVIRGPNGQGLIPVTYDQTNGKDFVMLAEAAMRHPKSHVVVIHPNKKKDLGVSRFDHYFSPQKISENGKSVIEMLEVVMRTDDANMSERNNRPMSFTRRSSVRPVDLVT